MYALVYAPDGIVGEDGSKVIVTDTLKGAQWEMERQVAAYLVDNELGPLDVAFSSNEHGLVHATVGLGDVDAAEWHIYEVLSPAMRSLYESISFD